MTGHRAGVGRNHGVQSAYGDAGVGGAGLERAGSQLGSLCLSAEAYPANCGVAGLEIPTHLAFQLRRYPSGGYQQAPNDLLGYLGKMGCLYDDWVSTNSTNQQINAQPQNPASALRACG